MTTDITELGHQHKSLTRRHFLELGAAGAAAMATSSLWADSSDTDKALKAATAKLQYLTPLDKFRHLGGRGKPPPTQLKPDQLRKAGLTRETWSLDVIADPNGKTKISNPLTKQRGTALDFDALMKIAKTKAVSFLQVLTCTNIAGPLGMGLWEGVPLRDVIWLAKPTRNIRRVFYYGYRDDDPKQMFRSSLPIGRILEDPPGEHPVILCYKLNGQWLSTKAGGPVRVVVPNAYANKSIKWAQHIVLTSEHKANDTYAEGNNDTVSAMKTCARFIQAPKQVRAGQPIAITGLAQVGISGLSKVQYWLRNADEPLPAGDEYFTKAPWRNAEVLGPPDDWGGGLPKGKLPKTHRQTDPKTGKPLTWPLHNTIVHWAALLTAPKAGKYELRCRTIDANNYAQPMPRPLPRSGYNVIQSVPMIVKE